MMHLLLGIGIGAVVVLAIVVAAYISLAKAVRW